MNVTKNFQVERVAVLELSSDESVQVQINCQQVTRRNKFRRFVCSKVHFSIQDSFLKNKSEENTAIEIVTFCAFISFFLCLLPYLQIMEKTLKVKRAQ